MAKRIDLQLVPVVTGSVYPAPFDSPCVARARQRLGDAAGLTDFGVNLLRLAPGVWSSQRHWHSAEDEFVFIVEGEVVLVTDAGEELLRAGSRTMRESIRISICGPWGDGSILSPWNKAGRPG